MTVASEPTADSGAMSEAAFATISQLARSEAGLVLPPGKATMVQSRLRKRLPHVGLKDLDAYARFVCSDDGVSERRYMISALTTNVSHFFREAHHFTILRDLVFPELITRARSGGRVRIWSAGCSSGQEPYSIAMALLSAAPDMAQRDVLILGSDIDPTMIQFSEAATYSDQQVAGIAQDLRSTYMTPASQDGFTVTPPVRKMVRFRELNLLGPWPMRGQFDIIFCRNVVIYFDQQTQAALWPRFHGALAPSGWFFIGHSERISDASVHLYQPVGQTAYRAVPAGL